VITFEETVALLAYLSRLNPAMRLVDGMAKAWHDQLAEFTAAEVEAAARRVGGEQTWVGVADLRQACKAARTARLEAAGDLYRLVQRDIDDPGYHAEYQRIRREVSMGIRTGHELEAGR
jgi:hypothetical protein